MDRRGFLKALGVAGASAAVFGLAGCGRNEEKIEPPAADPADRARFAVIARDQLRTITGDVNSLNNTIRILNKEMFSDEPLFFTNDQIDRNDISPRMIIININTPEAGRLDQLSGAVARVGGTFGRMNWDKQNPDSDDHVFTKEQIAEVGEEEIQRGITIDARFNEMLKNAQRAGIISYSGNAPGAPSVER